MEGRASVNEEIQTRPAGKSGGKEITREIRVRAIPPAPRIRGDHVGRRYRKRRRCGSRGTRRRPGWPDFTRVKHFLIKPVLARKTLRHRTSSALATSRATLVNHLPTLNSLSLPLAINTREEITLGGHPFPLKNPKIILQRIFVRPEKDPRIDRTGPRFPLRTTAVAFGNIR